MLSTKNSKSSNKKPISGSVLYFIGLHVCIWIYSLVSILNKLSAGYPFKSLQYLGLFASMIFVLFVYAILWQQVIKKFKISVAYCNKSVTIIWATIYAVFIFGEKITLKMMIGILMIVAGVIVISFKNSRDDE